MFRAGMPRLWTYYLGMNNYLRDARMKALWKLVMVDSLEISFIDADNFRQEGERFSCAKVLSAEVWETDVRFLTKTNNKFSEIDIFQPTPWLSFPSLLVLFYTDLLWA